ncbi:hypothetical protein AEM51_08175 [Bacteroidetes bacterium UKL13-3]|nr:hypothetical protein AEM51_08175 [Bacteroidetes bacterium UKL13-3]HCP94258.1 hypothetical protein [Bacteroidota bacterium]
MIQLDLSYLQTISRGDQTFIKEMLTMFLTTTFPELTELKQHAASQSLDMLGSTAHKMKAPIQILGVPVVSDLVLEIETIGKFHVGADSLPQKIELLEGYLKELENQINAILKA